LCQIVTYFDKVSLETGVAILGTGVKTISDIQCSLSRSFCAFKYVVISMSVDQGIPMFVEHTCHTLFS
jgi:tmRNA-binding protein